MKALLAILALALSLVGCVNNPTVTITSPDGTKTTLTTGRNLGAEVDEQVSEVEGGGFHLRHMVKRQDATRVLVSLIRTAGTLGVGYIAYLDRLEQEVTSRVLAGEITKQKGAELLAGIENAKLAAKAGATTQALPLAEKVVVNPVTPP